MLQELTISFIGEVGIKDYGEKDNEDLAVRFDVKKDDYPVAVLFTKNEGRIEHVKYAGKFKVEYLKTFVRKHSGIYMPLIGCIEEFDVLADELLAASDKDKEDVLKRAESLWDKAEGAKTQRAS